MAVVVELGPWAVDRGVGPFGRAVLSCVQCEPVGVGSVLCRAEQCCGVEGRGSRCRDEACWVAGEEGKVWDRVDSRGRSGSRKLRLRLRVRSMQSEAAVVLIVEVPVDRGERQSTINKEEKGLQGGYQKKMSEDGGLIQDCATTGAAAMVKLAR